jgi:hypothetical protein
VAYWDSMQAFQNGKVALQKSSTSAHELVIVPGL